MPPDGNTTTDRGAEPAPEHNEVRFRLVVEASPAALVMIRTTGQIELINAETVRLFGYSRQELLGQPVEMLLPRRFRERHSSLCRTFFDNPQTRPMGAGCELSGLRKDGTEFPVEIGLNPVDAGDGPMLLAIIADTSARKRMEERFRRVIESAPSAMLIVRATGLIDMANTQAEHMFGYPRQELLGQYMGILVPERFRARHAEHFARFHTQPQPRMMGTGRLFVAARKDGTEFPVEIGLTPIETGDGLMTLAVIVDISEHTRAARALARSEAEFRASFEGTAVGKLLADPRSRRILRANRAFAGMIGCEPEALLGRACPELIWHEDRAADAACHARLLSGENDTNVCAKRYVRLDGSPFWVRTSATIARTAEDDDRTIVVMTIEDIDTQHKAEAALRTAKRELEQVVEERTNALNQRDLLLREVYHRVKNNLQLVDSLLTMQARKIEDPQARQALSTFRGRIFALGLVHQQLMGSADLKTFDVEPFLDDLLKNILEGGGPDGVKVSVTACELKVGLDFAVPLGLLVTELVTNSLKHAFPNGSGTISVVLRNDNGGKLVLIVSDDGAGPSATGKSGAGIGTRIITNLVKQLEGTMTVRNENGMTTEIRIAIPDHA